MIKKPFLGEILVSQGVITQDQVTIALTEQKRSNDRIGDILVRLGFVTDAVIRDALSGIIGHQSISLNEAVVDSEAIKMIPREMASSLRLLPLTYDNQKHQLTVAMVDIFDVVALDQVNNHIGSHHHVIPVLASEIELQKAIDRFYGFELSVDGILHEIETGEVDYQSFNIESAEYSQPVVRLVNALLVDAVKRNASDIHFEPEEGFLRFRYRIDGVLRQVRSLHKNYWSAIAVRLKVMSGIDIAETRAPQDGRMSMSLSGRRVDFRVSTLPTIHGENIVLRILDRQKGVLKIEDLGLDQDSVAILKLMIKRPEGIILVTGPTGSGKTTTLYSILNHLNDDTVNIMTLEDPVEYTSALLRQTAVNETVRLDFANGVRSMMRQDPDIILVGEIRDRDTAKMAFQAAMTGHQVFSTLHANSTLNVIPRLLDIGVHAGIISGNIIGIIAQRLLRVLCSDCKKIVSADQQTCHLLGLNIQDSPKIYTAVGCQHCEKQGYKGRIAIQEILRINQHIDALIASKAPYAELLDAALQIGFQPLLQVAIARVINGLTTIQEVSRVVDMTSKWQQIQSLVVD